MRPAAALAAAGTSVAAAAAAADVPGVGASPAAPQPPPAGILLSGAPHKPRAEGIRWDEEVIAQHNLERGTRQPIEEPNTPFNREKVDGLDDEDAVRFQLCARHLHAQGTASEGQVCSCSACVVAQPGAVDPVALAERLALLQGTEPLLLPTATEEARRREFELQRRLHYDEHIVAQMLGKMPEEEDDGEEEEERVADGSDAEKGV